ncbi:hypothetical protein Plhal304r1_c018g0063681 [Plasmopara halstedii]
MKTQCQKERQMRLSKIDHSGILYRKIISLSNPLLQTYSKKIAHSESATVATTFETLINIICNKLNVVASSTTGSYTISTEKNAYLARNTCR